MVKCRAADGRLNVDEERRPAWTSLPGRTGGLFSQKSHIGATCASVVWIRMGRMAGPMMRPDRVHLPS